MTKDLLDSIRHFSERHKGEPLCVWLSMRLHNTGACSPGGLISVPDAQLADLLAQALGEDTASTYPMHLCTDSPCPQQDEEASSRLRKGMSTHYTPTKSVDNPTAKEHEYHYWCAPRRAEKGINEVYSEVGDGSFSLSFTPCCICSHHACQVTYRLKNDDGTWKPDMMATEADFDAPTFTRRPLPDVAPKVERFAEYYEVTRHLPLSVDNRRMEATELMLDDLARIAEDQGRRITKLEEDEQ